MSTDLAVVEPSLPAVKEDELFERVASAYLRLTDKTHKRVRIREALDAVLARYPDVYNREVAADRLRTTAFSDILTTRRKEHIARRAVATLYAAELGGKIGEEAGTELLRRLIEDPTTVSTKNLVAIVKLGFDLASMVDKNIEEITGTTNVQVNMDFRNMMQSMEPAKAAELMVEVVRRAKLNS